MITGIDHVVLRVADVERSVAWYEEHLGVRPERLAEWRLGRAPFVSLRVGPSSLIDLVDGDGGGTDNGARRDNVDHVAYVTDRVGFDRFVDAHRAVIEMGPAPLFGARGIGDGVYLRDPDGHRLEIRTYEPAGAVGGGPS